MSCSDQNCPFREALFEASRVLKDTKTKLSDITDQLNGLEHKLNYLQNDMHGCRTLTERTSFHGTEAQSWSEIDKSRFSGFFTCSSERRDAALASETVAEVARNIKIEPSESSELNGCETLVTACSRESSSRKRSAEDNDNRQEESSKCQRNDVHEQPGSSTRVTLLNDVSVKMEVPEYDVKHEITSGNTSRSSEKTDELLSVLSGVVCARALRALKNIGFAERELQAQVILPMLNGRNIIVSRGNGSVKTAAFLIATVEMLCEQKFLAYRGTRVIILCPTSARASQTFEILEKLMSFHSGVTCGILTKMGSKRFQLERNILSRGLHILVAIQCRFITHLYTMNIHFNHLQCVVFDNVDLTQISNLDRFKRIITLLPSCRQVAVFTTDKMPQSRDIDEILGPNLLYVTVDKVQQSSNADGLNHYYVHCKTTERTLTIYKFLNAWHRSEKIIVFFSTAFFIKYYKYWLCEFGIPVYTMRTSFKKGEAITENLEFLSANRGILLCTPSQCSGLDIDGVTVVIHYDCRPVQEYIHNSRYAAHGVGNKGKSIILLHPSQDVYLRTLEDNGIFIRKCDFTNYEIINIEEFHSKLQNVVKSNRTALALGKKVCGMATEFNPAKLNSVAVTKSFGL